jgi:hypothetical protein
VYERGGSNGSASGRAQVSSALWFVHHLSNCRALWAIKTADEDEACSNGTIHVLPPTPPLLRCLDICGIMCRSHHTVHAHTRTLEDDASFSNMLGNLAPQTCPSRRVSRCFVTHLMRIVNVGPYCGKRNHGFVLAN